MLVDIREGEEESSQCRSCRGWGDSGWTDQEERIQCRAVSTLNSCLILFLLKGDHNERQRIISQSSPCPNSNITQPWCGVNRTLQTHFSTAWLLLLSLVMHYVIAYCDLLGRNCWWWQSCCSEALMQGPQMRVSARLSISQSGKVM